MDRILLGYFLVSAMAVFGLWAGYFADGTAAPAVFEPSQETGTLIGRTVAALAAGLSLAIAATERFGVSQRVIGPPVLRLTISG